MQLTKNDANGRAVYVKTLGLMAVLTLTAAGAVSAAAVEHAAHERMVDSPNVSTRVIEDGTIIRKTSRFEVRITPLREEAAAGQMSLKRNRHQAGDHPSPVSACPTSTVTHSSFNFEGGGAMLLQGGFVETEIAAAQHVVDSEAFPVRVDVMEKIFGTQNTTVTTTTEWTVMIWAGPPNSGQLVDEFSSDDIILPHLIIPPGTNGVNVQVIVDPNDPEPIIVPANASNSVTIGFRIDKHNNPPTNTCPCPLFGTLPAVCCPPASNSNAFPSNDTNGVSNPSRNWLWARNCPGAGTLCGVAPQGWYNFNTGGTPSGDWNIRLTYTALNCPEGFGACCLPNGTCQILGEAACQSQNGAFQGENVLCQNVFCEGSGACCLLTDQGTVCQEILQSECDDQLGFYQGDNVTCVDAECPMLQAACCINGQCQLLSEEDCDAANGNWLGSGFVCDAGICDGACCIEATGACVDFSEANCSTVGGLWQGPATSCASLICFPSGACCLPDGTCADDLSPEDCADAGGNFQGDGTTCAETSCPEPTGACCLASGGCIDLIESTCIAVAGDWKGFLTDCTDSNDSGVADACEEPAPDECPADINNDGVVDGLDLLQLLSAWGDCNDPNDCPEDINNDGVVDGLDLLQLLSAWGDCP